MKKYISFGILALVSVLFLTGCDEDKTITCTSSSDQSASGYKMNSEYKIFSEGDVVNKVETTEEIESSNTTVLAYFEKTIKEQYQENNEKYGGYRYEINNEDGKLTVNVTIDYSKWI